MERESDIYKGYNEIYSEHYGKWEAAQSKRYFEYRKKWEENAKKLFVEKFPLHIDIGITNSCNLKCTFCPRTILIEEGKWRDVKHMDMEMYKKIIDESVELGTYSINLNLLNEPLVHPKIIEMIKYAKEKGIVDVHFHTHGGLLSEKMCNELLESGLDKLLVSIDSPDKEEYEKLRVLSDFDTVVGGLLRFKKMRDDRGLLNPLIKCNFIQFPGITKEKLNEDISFGLELGDSVGLQEYIRPTLDNGEGINFQPGYKSSFVCQQPFTRIAIIEDGRVSPCCTDSNLDLIVGDLNKQTLLEIWESKKMQNVRKLHSDGEYYKLKACKNCDVAINGDKGIETPYDEFGPTL
jgi:radical SAM protein with 4Fe4S-binding SPASM domain